ncbi:unnamed protein product [Paramecium primaurelia]|uniref:Uncharacterized protein n=1 Tax=Paramecium primaurelia TaxID=5886 RepID=A0A8S1M2T8_PARPR|nr:unnamed protein product [Paramecium primaurelia]
MSKLKLIETIKQQEKLIQKLQSQIKRSQSHFQSPQNIKQQNTQRSSSRSIQNAKKLKEKDQTINILTERLNKAFENENYIKYKIQKQRVMFKCLYNDLQNEVYKLKTEMLQLKTPQRQSKKLLYY